jgi:hypothetical protein
MLASHEERNHDVRNLVVRERAPGAVRLAHERRDHVVLVAAVRASRTPAFDDVLVERTHVRLRGVAPAVRRQRQVREHEVQRREPAVEVVVEPRERLVEPRAHLRALQRARRGQDRDRREHVHDVVQGAPFVYVVLLPRPPGRIVVHEVVHLILDHA